MNPDDGILEAITRFVHWLAWKSSDESTPLMEYDEVVGELFEEVAKGIKRYGDLPHSQQLAVIRRMCDNRVAELRYKYYVTHRKEARLALDISILEADAAPDESNAGGRSGQMSEASIGHKWLMDNAPTTEGISDSAFRVAETRRRLSSTAQSVFDVVVFPNDRMATQILLSGIRATAVYKGGGTVKVRPHHVAEALCMTETTAHRAFAEIRRTYREVRERYG